MARDINFRKWLRLYEALDPATKASLEKADTRRFPDREFLKKAIEDMEAEPEMIPAADAWRRLNTLAASSGKGASKGDAAMQKLASIMPRGTTGMEEYIQMWRGGRMSLPELYSLAFFSAKGAPRNALGVLAREMVGLDGEWRKRINFSERPQIATNNGLSEFDDIGDFSAAIHALAASDLDMSGKLEFDPKTDIDPARRKDLVAGGRDKGIWIYKGPDPTMCRTYGKGGGKGGDSPWCVAQTSNSHHYFDYRINKEQTFFFIFDTHKSKDDPARRVLAGVSGKRGQSEWGDMKNENKIKGYGGVDDYKRYLAGKLGMSVPELDEKMKPEPVTDAEKKLKKYLDDYANAS